MVRLVTPTQIYKSGVTHILFSLQKTVKLSIHSYTEITAAFLLLTIQFQHLLKVDYITFTYGVISYLFW